MSLLLLALAALAGVVIWFIGGFNKFVHLKALVDEAWSGIDVQLKRRYDLIPNLVAVVKQYATHEKSIFEDIARARSRAINAQGVEDKASAESGLTQTLKTLFAVAENYPNLKANENFLSLQQDLGAIENEIQLSRRYYNGAARNYNVAVTTFPARLIAAASGYHAVPYFELNTAAERENPQITF
ncbi:membrane protein [Candidatus Dependentiae bacterium Noda2021]|nr:membrane protein [Candidatus Dependentiae bacterium Noda2021]